MKDIDKCSKLFLDDERAAPDETWAVIRSYEEFVGYIQAYGVPDLISFDHDLGAEKTGYDCAKWLAENGYGMKAWRVHSMNPVGRENIRFMLKKNGEEYL